MLATIVYKFSKNVLAADVSRLYQSVGWGKVSSDKWKFKLSHSQFCITAWSSGLLVGVGRILGDGDDAVIFGVAVHPKYQHQKIGTNIMSRLCEKAKVAGYYGINLFASADNKNAKIFYTSLGFESKNNAMWKKL